MCAEEEFYVTLFHLPEAPIGNVPFHQASVGALWVYTNQARHECNAAVRHDVCLVGVGTMKMIGSRTEFFMNKYSEEHDHVIMDCAEKRIVERNKAEYIKDCSERKRGYT